MKLTNRTNRIIYKLWAPIYDAVTRGFFRSGRLRSIAALDAKPSERILLVGIGTGADLPLLPKGITAVGVDLSEAMLSRARAKLPLSGLDISLEVGDAVALSMEDETFDGAVMNLILSVVPNPRQCMRETLRVLRPGGRVVIFDKFLPDGAEPTTRRRLVNLVSTLLGTDINRRLVDIVSGLDCEIVRNEPSILGGMYRVVVLRMTE